MVKRNLLQVDDELVELERFLMEAKGALDRVRKDVAELERRLRTLRKLALALKREDAQKSGRSN